MFLDYEKRKIRYCLISCFPPAHRIRICLQDRFGFRPPPSPHRAQARGGIFRPSYELCCIALLCSNLFWTTNGLMRTPRVRGGLKLNHTLRFCANSNNSANASEYLGVPPCPIAFPFFFVLRGIFLKRYGRWGEGYLYYITLLLQKTIRVILLMWIIQQRNSETIWNESV